LLAQRADDRRFVAEHLVDARQLDEGVDDRRAALRVVERWVIKGVERDALQYAPGVIGARSECMSCDSSSRLMNLSAPPRAGSCSRLAPSCALT